MSELLDKTDKFVFDLFKDSLPNSFIYHNYTHTKRVLKSANEIINDSDLSEKEETIIRLAALLHDTGYTKKREGHEEESAHIAAEFLEKQGVDQEIVEDVKNASWQPSLKIRPTTNLKRLSVMPMLHILARIILLKRANSLEKNWKYRM